MLIYSPQTTNRLKYTLDLIINEILGCDYNLCNDPELFKVSSEPKINYSEESQLGGIQVVPSGLLFSAAITPLGPDMEIFEGEPIIFVTKGTFPFDVFSAVFYMVSRYEEYMDCNLDAFDRFQAVESFAFKNGFLEKPVVNIWVNKLKNEISRKYPSVTFKTSKFTPLLTYDIDVAYKYKGRSLLKNLLLVVKETCFLQFNMLQNRLRVFFKSIPDPWDIYQPLKNQLEEQNLSSIFFFLSGPYSKYNKNLSPDNPLQIELVDKIDQWSKIGIHPSFDSYLNPITIGKEKAEIEKVIRKPVIRSRQHFLKLKLPETYRYLLEVGIKEDHTMGFADRAGFRAGICTPFYFYNLKSEMVTDLKVFPITYMDGSLFKYEKLSVKDAKNKVKKLVKEVKDVEGLFISLWHNHTLSNDKEHEAWHEVHSFMINELSNRTK